MQREIGDYQLVRQLGYGSMGETYLAEHRYLRAPFVVKVLPQELYADADFIARFKETVPRLSYLEHPHLARVHNAFGFEKGFALVSELVTNTLSSREISPSESDVLRIVRQLASVLDYVHSQGVAHGSIKLSNIRIKQTDQGMDAVLTDCGLSAFIHPASVLGRVYHYLADWMCRHGHVQLPKETYLQGIPHIEKAAALQSSFCERFFFLAPEQKRADQAILATDKTDGYALGVFAYYLLTDTFPEGCCPMPSQIRSGLEYNWDLWLSSLLHPDPSKRPELLLTSLDEWVMVKNKTDGLQQLKALKQAAERAQDRLACLAGSSIKPLLKPQEIARPSFEPDPGAVFQVDTTVSAYRPEPQQDRQIDPLLTEMVIIPAGTYVRGSNHGGRDEMPRHAISLNAFAIDIHPVTNEQFVLFLEAMGGEKDVNNNDIIRLRDSRIKRSGGRLNIESGYDQHPVVGVTWYGAVAYAKWVGKRLPTEAEWEVAALGGREDILFPTGSQMDRSHANFFSSDTTPVMSYVPNGLGLFDMAGNVYEWCQDWYDYHFYDISIQEPNNPTGPAQGVYRVLRGGCWKSSKEDLRCAHRHRNNPGLMNGTYGFRCAADVV